MPSIYKETIKPEVSVYELVSPIDERAILSEK